MATPCSFAIPRSPNAPSSPVARLCRLVYLDASNIVCAGAQVSAVHRGMCWSAQHAAEAGITDFGFRLHFGHTLEFAVGECPRECVRAIAFGSVRQDAVTSWVGAATWAGWETRIHRRSPSGREKEVDTSMCVAMLEDAMHLSRDVSDPEVTVFSGDRDLTPAIEALSRMGIAVDVATWSHAASGKLKSAARRVVLLDDYFDYLRYNPSAR